MKAYCPHCGEELMVRSSEQLSDTVREARAICSNPACACSLVINVEAVRMITPSGTPNKQVRLPYSRAAWDKLQQHAQLCIFTE